MRNPAESRTMSLAGAGVVSLDDVSVLDNAALSPFSLNRFSAGVSCQSWMKDVSGVECHLIQCQPDTLQARRGLSILACAL